MKSSVTWADTSAGYGCFCTECGRERGMMHKKGCPADNKYQGEVLCEVNGIPVLVRNEGGQVRTPKGLEGVAAYFEAKGTPRDVYPRDETGNVQVETDAIREMDPSTSYVECPHQCQVCLSDNAEHHFCDDCLYEDDIQHIRIELPNGPSFRFRVPEGWDPDVSAHGLTDAGHTILSVEREEGPLLSHEYRADSENIRPKEPPKPPPEQQDRG